ncbi:MAG TPA: hypothetical protein VL337_01250 [Acidimicrobiales bacterium]|nr:hypothetical protein [Acidimicrobiales bacterium]
MRAEALSTLSTYTCHLDGRPVQASVAEDGLVVAGRLLAWLDMDEVRVDGWNVELEMAGGPPVALTQLGRARDDFLADLRAARSPVRRAALLQWTGDVPVDAYVAGHGDEAQTLTLFPDGLTIEPLVGPPTSVPLGLVQDVRRDGYAITLVLRGLPATVVRQLGTRTDEFLEDLDRARADLAERTAAAYAAYDPALAGLGAPDGWAVTAEDAGRHWAPLRAAVAGDARASEVEALEALAGGRLRLGIKAVTGGTEPLPFALAPVGAKVAVEGTDTDARATYVFAPGPAERDVDRLNVVLLLLSFRREALYLPEDQLGRWAVAVRTLEVVRWARAALAGRVVHDEQWEAKVRAALA